MTFLFFFIICHVSATMFPCAVRIPGYHGYLASCDYLRSSSQRLDSMSAYDYRYYNQSPMGPPGRRGDSAPQGLSDQRGQPGPQGPAVYGKQRPASLKKISRVRTEFPEAWIWTEIDSRYPLQNILNRGFSHSLNVDKTWT